MKRLALVLCLVSLATMSFTSQALAKTEVDSAGATAECDYPLAVDCPRDNEAPIPFATVPAGTPSVKVTYKSTSYCAPMLLIIYDNGKVAGETSIVGGDTGVAGATYPDEGSTSFSPVGDDDHELAYRGKVTGFGCGVGTHPGEVLSLHLFVGEVLAEFTPPPEGVAIKGTVRIENDRGIAATASGVPGASVQITGPGGKKTVKVDPTGAYSARFKKAGRYTVYPRVPDRITRGARNPVKPAYRDVNLKLGDTGTANFTVKDPLRVSLDLGRKEVPADGLQTVEATIAATADGKPAKGLHVLVRPFDGAAMPVFSVPVPATICRSGHGGGRLWPAPAASAGAQTDSVDAVTDAQGQVHLRISTGTVPGPFKLQVWAANDTGALDTEHNILDVSPEETLRVAPLGSSGAFESELTRLVKSDSGLQLVTTATGLADQLAGVTAAGHLGNYDYAPIEAVGGTRHEGVLVYPAGARVPIEADGSLGAATPGQVLKPEKHLRELARSGLPALPTMAEWTSAKGPWATKSPGIAAPVRPDARGYAYFGYGYPSKGGCS
ncbi:MAG TPA: carboxypeptidase-like regulatory domain-containing protein [Solirubrobacterales bacterium]|nr:carboxypeptidase-like regulatory domain-containing protein [Solirubrobacterales bacterium]